MCHVRSAVKHISVVIIRHQNAEGEMRRNFGFLKHSFFFLSLSLSFEFSQRFSPFFSDVSKTVCTDSFKQKNFHKPKKRQKRKDGNGNVTDDGSGAHLKRRLCD